MVEKRVVYTANFRPPDFFMISPTNRSRKLLDRIGIEAIEIKTENPEEAIKNNTKYQIRKLLPRWGSEDIGGGLSVPPILPPVQPELENKIESLRCEFQMSMCWGLVTPGICDI